MAENPDFGTFGRYRETPVDRMPADMRAAYDDTLKLRGSCPVRTRSGWRILRCAHDRPDGRLLPDRVDPDQGRDRDRDQCHQRPLARAYGNYEHEKIAVEKGGLAPEKVEALIAGLPTSFDDPRQQVVYELASALAAARVVPLGLYRRARICWGTRASLM